MLFSFKIKQQDYQFDSRNYYDISIPMQFNGKQPNSYNVKKATSKAYKTEGFIGDTRKGGGCNFEIISIIPHCNGTHTECIGHITNDRISIVNQLKDTMIPSTLISITPQLVSNIKKLENYHPPLNENDVIITKRQLKEAIDNKSDFIKGLIIRTLPNNSNKKSMEYTSSAPPFLSMDAMEYIVSLGVDHLLIDLPSVDRTFDEGKLSAHHIFWNINQGSHQLKTDSAINKTITEFIYIPDVIIDGKYLLNLQIAPFLSDASPSRPILFNILEKE